MRAAWPILLCLLIAALLPSPSAAQAPPTGNRLLPGQNRPALPEFAPSQPTSPFETPPPSVAPPPPSGPGPTILVTAFRFIGNKAISTADLAAVAAPFLGKPITAEDLEELRIRLTQLYVDRGYINSGAILPDQQVTNGIVTYQIVEGKLSEIRIAGERGLDPDYIRDRLALGAGPPLNTNELGDRFRILLQDPLISQLNGRLLPGTRPGEALLDVDVERAKPYDFSLFVDNYRPPSVGSVEGGNYAAVRNLTGWGDSVFVNYSHTSGLDDVTGGGSLPLNRWDTTLHIQGEWQHSKLIEEPFNQLDIEGDYWDAEIGIRQPVWRDPENELALDLTFARRHSTSSLLGEPFDFTPSTRNGNEDVSVLRLAQEFTHRSPDQVIALRSTFNFGLGVLGSTDNNFEPDGQFFDWLGQLQAAQRLPFHDIEIVLRADAQISADPLLPLEQFAVGGPTSVRGYRENQFVNDSGLDASIEMRVPVLTFAVPVLGEDLQNKISLAPFFDWGASWSHDHGFRNRQEIYSAGIGLLWSIAGWLDASLYYGYALKKIDFQHEDTDLQDQGISFRVSINPSQVIPW